MPVLVTVDQQKRRQSWGLDGEEMCFGRAQSNDIVLLGHGVSRFHGRFVKQGATWSVQDLGSSNGIVVNGQFVSRHELVDGDRLLIGEYTATYHCKEPPDAAATSVSLSDSARDTTVVLDRTPGPAGPIDSRRLSILYEISRRLLDQRDISTLIETATSALMAELKTDVIVFGLTTDPDRDADRIIVWPPRTGRLFLSRSVLMRSLRERRSILASDSDSGSSLMQAQSVIDAGIRSILSVPLARNDQVCGFIYAANRHGERQYDGNDLEFASAVGMMVGTAIENARLLEAERLKERMEAELASAREVQQAIMPTEWVQVPGWEICGHHRSSREVGGDYYDAVLAGDRLWLIVADVCGKGVPAALMASGVHSAFHAIVDSCISPAAMLTRMNQLLLRRSYDSRFITCLVVAIHTQDGTTLVSSAGHPSPVHLTPGAAPSPLQLEADVPLGLFHEATYSDTVVSLSSLGSTLVLYTDGLSEASNAHGEQFADRRMVEVLGGSQEMPSQHLLELIIREQEAFQGRESLSDDVTILVCRRLG